MSPPIISAIICTHNRDQYLGAAIDSLLIQDFPDFEVVVVDNGCTDRTREVVEARLSDPRLRYVYESVLGLSVARNRGAQETTGEILAYLDDDAVVSPQWLSCLVQAFAANEKLAIAGGKVNLIWPDGMTPPKWMSTELSLSLGFYDLGSEPVLITQPGLTPRGLNYAIRRTFLEQVNGFDVNLGRIGKRLLSNEELYMTELALTKGWQVLYIPEALALHNVSPERTKQDWFMRRSWWQGVSECYREQVAGRAGIGQLRRGGERLIRGAYKVLKYFGDPAIRFDNLTYVYGQIGYLSSVIQGFVTSSESAKRP